MIFAAVTFLVLMLWKASFTVIERTFSLFGLALLVFAVAAVKLHPGWNEVAHGFVPGVPATGEGTTDDLLVYAYGTPPESQHAEILDSASFISGEDVLSEFRCRVRDLMP